MKHGHVITLDMTGFYTGVARCACRSFLWGPYDVLEAWIAGHRRKHFARFRG